MPKRITIKLNYYFIKMPNWPTEIATGEINRSNYQWAAKTYAWIMMKSCFVVYIYFRKISVLIKFSCFNFINLSII